MKNSIQDFDVQIVPLQGKNLIEASAGTGKTYSVAIMVLRLILEKDIHIREILMVTFTKAAVAELEERIRRFIRLASRYASGENIDDVSIKAIVEKVSNEKNLEFVKEKLRSAVINLDETSVMTIHSFCQQTLTEFAFETNQLFNAELQQDMMPILEEATQKFWRNHITSLNPDLLAAMLDRELSIESIIKVISNQMDGKLFYTYDETVNYHLNSEKQEELLKSLKDAEELVENLRQDLYDGLKNRREELISLCESNTSAKKAFLPLVDDCEEFVARALKSKTSKYVTDLFGDILEAVEHIDATQTESEAVFQNCLNYIYSFAIQEIVQEIEKRKIQLNQMSFDDVITKTYLALNQNRDNPAKQRLQQDLIRGLQWKYKAVFIDEFQDTDKLQYQIFNKAFGENTIVFYIGDPKQSIYAWRKADIETYFEARRNVDFQYTMKTNYRSSANLVSALNKFFLPTKDFDTFYYQTEEGPAIEYIEVNTPKSSKKGEMTRNGNPIVPVSVSKHSNKNDLRKDVIAQISELLNNPDYKIKDRAVKPSDIGVLVRTNAQGDEIKAALARIGIPAVTVTESKILQSSEAAELVYVLEAILNQTRSNVNRALTTSFINWTPDEILRLDEDIIIQRFRDYFLKWQNSGIYAALTDFIHGFNIQQKLLSGHTENGERMITNLYHLMEVLYKTENRQHFGPAELLDWLKINRSKSESSDDEMIQRIESDEEAVRIVTIHRSKGLEYNIVIAPNLDFVLKPYHFGKNDIISIRNENGDYVSLKRNQADEETAELYRIQSEQENRRLLYVALTRAVYKCFIYKSTANYYKGSTLEAFMNVLNFEETQGLIEKIPPLQIEKPKGYRTENLPEQFSLNAENFRLSHRNWTQTSYSRLAAHPEYIVRKNYELTADSYDRFIFHELTKGAKTGTFIHDIFENVDFSDSKNWNYAIERSINRFVPDKDEEYAGKIEHFLSQVLNTEIDTGNEQFRLADISSNELLHEMEFDFPMKLFNIKTLETLIENGITVKNAEDYPQQIEGIMTGFVDLFFRHNGKFYVLDWKTNYLGPRVEDYSPEKLEEAMTDNNYHLQYLIYSYAVKLYLKHRLGDAFDFEQNFGGVLYLFVRGMREGKTTGIYFAKPSVEQMRVMGEVFGAI